MDKLLFKSMNKSDPTLMYTGNLNARTLQKSAIEYPDFAVDYCVGMFKMK